MSNTHQAVARITAAEALTEPRDLRGMMIGDVGHQGDVYVCRVARHEDIYRYCRLLRDPRPRGAATAERQVAPGNTLGSRHVARGEGLRLWAPPPGASPLEGPTIEADGEWWLDHPEHAPHRYGPGVFVVTYQREYAEEVRRVAD